MNYRSVEDYITMFKTEHKYGFNPQEKEQLIQHFGGFEVMDEEKFYSALRGITCIINERGETIIYPCDLITAVCCGLEKRDMHTHEWD